MAEVAPATASPKVNAAPRHAAVGTTSAAVSQPDHRAQASAASGVSRIRSATKPGSGPPASEPVTLVTSAAAASSSASAIAGRRTRPSGQVPSHEPMAVPAMTAANAVEKA